MSLDWVAVLAGVLTLAGWSYLYRENFIFRFVEHMLVGLTAAYMLISGIYYVKTYIGANSLILWIWPILLGLLLFTFFSKKYMYLYRIPMAFIMGIGSALTITSLGSASLIKQIAPLLKPVIITNNPLATANNIISLAGTILALMYFIFTRERTGIQAITSRIGRAFIMVMMGATFGSVAMTRFATDIDRVKALVTTDAFWAVPVFAILLIIFIIYDSRAAKKT